MLLYFSAHLSECQQNWHPFEQELWGLLCARRDQRDSVKHLGRIPVILHTDHANTTRLDALPLARVEPKHFRWITELLQGGSRLVYRPGTGVLHKGPDAISRHPEGRDQLILAKANEWSKHKAVIKGIEEAIQAGEFDDEEPVMVVPADLPPERLEPLSYDELLDAGAIGQGAETQIQGARKRMAEKHATLRSRAPAGSIGQAGSPGTRVNGGCL